ncbi:anoctamin-2 isoform X2 [Halichoeres trimaculatus]|uniref:anoctamin-2 isoform X2 n=1 Tax=Halichoeres trimaculatus TaxID=147232 RepID=UPI003D9FAB1B
MSETSSIHSAKLVSLARSISGLGLDASNGGTVNPPGSGDPPLPESGIDLGPGLYFADGKRKVDYVLCYKYKKRRASKPRLSLTSNGSIPFPIPGRWDLESGEAGEPAGDVVESKLSEEEKALMREEFELGLLEAGLQIERDKERLNSLRFIRLHIPWPTLSREAELQKIKVAVKKKCELRKRMGIAGWLDYIATKVSTPFQPDISDFDIQKDPQTDVHFKTLKHPFIRDKLHLYDIKSTETLFDNATRSRIVAEIISRVTCRQTCQTTAACFLEHWKRRQMCLRHTWDLMSLEDEEERLQEELRPEYEEALNEKKAKMRAKFKKKSTQAVSGVDGETDQMLSSQREPESLDIEDHLSGFLINVSTLLLLVFITFSAVFGVAVYRICMLTVWSMNPDHDAKASVRMTVTTTGIILNMLVVLVLEEVYGAIAVWLTELELPKTQEEFEEKLIFKSFFLKSMNAFAPIFYVAFFKGRFAGRPGDYVYVFGDYRMEECAPPGCLVELCIQLSMIMLGKQLIQNNVFEVLIPKLKKMYRTMQEKKGKNREAEEDDEEEKRPKQQFDKDFILEPFEGVTPEYMEMMIQYGFVTLFVASLPLAPAFALLNNVIEIRLDAAKFVTEIRRPDAVRCKDIGIWYNILCGISKFSVITNAFVISFTSEFVPRMVYQYMYSVNGTMNGYTEHSLSYFNVSNFPPGTAPPTDISMCRYKDFRDPPWSPEPYSYSKEYWSMLAAKLAFVIFFQNLAMFLSMVVAWMIPDVPRSLREQLKKDNMMLMEFLLNQDQETRAKFNSPRHSAPCFPSTIDILVEAPPEEQEEQQKKEEEEEEEDVETSMDALRRTRDSDPEVEKTAEDSEENRQEEQEGDGGDEVVEVEGEQKENDGEVKEEDEKEEEKQEKGEEEGKEEEKEDRKEEEKEVQVEAAENKKSSMDLDSLMSELGLFDQESSLSPATDAELPRSASKQEIQKDQEPPSHPSSIRGSTQSLKDSRAELTTSSVDPKPFSLIAPPPPREPGSRAKTRCSTLPSRHRGAEACYSLPRPSHSTSLTRFQQATTLTPLVPLSSTSSASSNPFSPPQTPVSPSSPKPTQDPAAQQPTAPSELFVLKGPPPQQPRSRGKARCSTLPARQRAPGPEEHQAKPSHSTSFAKLEDRVPPSPSELKRDTLL